MNSMAQQPRYPAGMPAQQIVQQPMTEKKVPTGVKVISVLYYISAFFSLLGGLFMIMASRATGEASIIFYIIPPAAFVIIGITGIVFGIVGVFLGRGLWKGKRWARITAIVFAILGTLFPLLFLILSGNIEIIPESSRFAVGSVGLLPTSLGTDVLSLLFNLVVGGYLLFSKKVKEAFAKST